jgi:hypothetical protein
VNSGVIEFLDPADEKITNCSCVFGLQDRLFGRIQEVGSPAPRRCLRCGVSPGDARHLPDIALHPHAHPRPPARLAVKPVGEAFRRDLADLTRSQGKA